ncbi:hypothetical protein RSAG8_10397, partial [Rhizoctonia solani AG-8 WAC10335]
MEIITQLPKKTFTTVEYTSKILDRPPHCRTGAEAKRTHLSYPRKRVGPTCGSSLTFWTLERCISRAQYITFCGNPTYMRVALFGTPDSITKRLRNRHHRPEAPTLIWGTRRPSWGPYGRCNWRYV